MLNTSSEIIALLGRRDAPTDALEEYCVCLGRALEARGFALHLVRVPWAEQGWWSALRWLWQQRSNWSGRWILVQYTALSWSRHGFPFGLLAMLAVLQSRGIRCVVVFHDSEVYAGERTIDRLRRACQRWVMRAAYVRSARSILTISPEKVSWLPANADKAVMIPVGANIPEPPGDPEVYDAAPHAEKTVVVFGITGGAHANGEIRDIAHAVGRAAQQVPALRLVVFGRNSEDAKDSLSHALNGTPVQLCVLGLLAGDEVTRTISAADALLFVRGGITSGHSSAIAGIACGLPVVSYADARMTFPISEAGIAPVSLNDREALGEALARVLVDDSFNRELRSRSRAAHREHFSWSVIAGRYAKVLGHA